MSDDRWLWPQSSIVRVVDGDTLVARVTRDVGFHGSLTFEVKLRIDGINAPALHTAEGRKAFAALVAILPVNCIVDIETTGPYKYGDEWMAHVTLPGNPPVSVADYMVSNGYAQVWDGKGPRPGG